MKFKTITKKIITLILAASMTPAASIPVSAANAEPVIQSVQLNLSAQQEAALLKATDDAFLEFAGISFKDGLTRTIEASETIVTYDDGSVDKDVQLNMELKDAVSKASYRVMFFGESFEEALKNVNIACDNLSAPTDKLQPYVTKLKAQVQAVYGVTVPDDLLFHMSGGSSSWLSIRLYPADSINDSNIDKKNYYASFNGVNLSTGEGTISNLAIANVLDSSKFEAMAEKAFKEQLGITIPAEYQLTAAYSSGNGNKVSLEWFDPKVDTSKENYKTTYYIADIPLADFNAGTGKIQTLSEMTLDTSFQWEQPSSYTNQELEVMKKAAAELAAKLGIQLGDYERCDPREKGFKLSYCDTEKKLDYQFAVTKTGDLLGYSISIEGVNSMHGI